MRGRRPGLNTQSRAVVGSWAQCARAFTRLTHDNSVSRLERTGPGPAPPAEALDPPGRGRSPYGRDQSGRSPGETVVTCWDAKMKGRPSGTTRVRPGAPTKRGLRWRAGMQR